MIIFSIHLDFSACVCVFKFPHNFGIQFRSHFDKAPLLKYHSFLGERKQERKKVFKHLQKWNGKNSNQSHTIKSMHERKHKSLCVCLCEIQICLN